MKNRLKVSSMTPSEVVEKLRQGDAQARAVVRGHIEECLRRLVDQRMKEWGNWSYRPEQLRESIFSWLEMVLIRSSDVPLTDWEELVGWMVLRVSCTLVGEDESTSPVPPGPQLPQDAFPGYRVEIHYRPLEAVSGDRAFWAHRSEFGWVFLCDVTGHGWPAHIVAEVLGPLWDAVPESETTPEGVLGWMNSQLYDRLPDSTFVEALLVRIGPDGQLAAASAGATLFEFVPGGKLQLGGHWLGLLPQLSLESSQCVLQVGQHCLLSTDGLMEQPMDVWRPRMPPES